MALSKAFIASSKRSYAEQAKWRDLSHSKGDPERPPDKYEYVEQNYSLVTLLA